MVGVWIAPVTAQVIMTFLCPAIVILRLVLELKLETEKMTQRAQKLNSKNAKK